MFLLEMKVKFDAIFGIRPPTKFITLSIVMRLFIYFLVDFVLPLEYFHSMSVIYFFLLKLRRFMSSSEINDFHIPIYRKSIYLRQKKSKWRKCEEKKIVP